VEHPGTAAAADDRERVVAELARLVGKVNPPRMGDGSHHDVTRKKVDRDVLNEKMMRSKSVDRGLFLKMT